MRSHAERGNESCYCLLNDWIGLPFVSFVVNSPSHGNRHPKPLVYRHWTPARREEYPMPERPPATVKLVDEHAATGKVAQVFADIKATKQIDFVPNFWRALATNP